MSSSEHPSEDQLRIISIMTKHFIAAICAVLFLSFTLSSCDTPTGQGAGWGAATGALIGAAATGDAEGAAVGAGIGAATGALLAPRWKQTSAVIMRVDRLVVILTLNERNIRGLSTARTRRTTSSTCAAFRMVRLCAILRRAEFSASRNSGCVDSGDGLVRKDQLVFFCRPSTMRCTSSSIRIISGHVRA